MESISDVLGGFGPGSVIRAKGTDWSFVFDVPAMVANVEEMCRQWHREQFDVELKQIGDRRDFPGSFESRMAEKAWDDFRAECKNGACDLPHMDQETGKLKTGAAYSRWVKTPEGQLGMLLSALRVKHKTATLDDLRAIATEKPEELRAVGEELKNVARTLPKRLAASLKSSNPKAASLIEEMAETLNGSLG